MDVPLIVRRSFDQAAHRVGDVAYRVLPIANPKRYGVRVHRNLPYRPTGRRAHLLDVYVPDGFAPRPAVLYVHGGGFTMLSKDTHRGMALMLAARGYCVFNINYRLAPTHHYPRPLEDAAAALLWVLEHGTDFGADLSRLAIMGESAGGNLTAALTYIATHPRPEPFAAAVFDRTPPLRASLPIYGIHQVHDVERFWRRRDPKKRRIPWVVRQELQFVAKAYLGSNPTEAPLASPLLLYQDAPPPGARPLPPFFLTAGTADPLLSDSRLLHEAVEARGGVSELHVYPGEIHAFNAFLWRAAARDKWRAVFRFLARHLMPERPAPDIYRSSSPDTVAGTIENRGSCSTTRTA